MHIILFFQRCLLTIAVVVMLEGCVPTALFSSTVADGGQADTQPAQAEPRAQPVGTCPVGMSRANQTSQQSRKQSVNMTYSEKTQTITLEKGTRATLAAVSAELGQPDVLREVAPGEWLLAANVLIERGAALMIQGPEVRWLKLQSDSQRFVSIKSFGGNLSFTDTCVTSWDSLANTVDTNHADGRSFILARSGAQMNILRSELSYLGYDANESYGVAWRLKGTSGSVIDSTLGYNYYGMYSYEASDLVIRGNEVHHSIRYGIDPHTNSNRLTIERNISHHNGKHGIILADSCSDSVIRDNQVYNNQMHGIVLYQGSNRNRVEGNTSYGNGQQGININDSSDNTVRNNTVHTNVGAGIGLGRDSNSNTVVENEVRDNSQDGIYLYSDAKRNRIEKNTVRGNGRYGIYAKSGGNTLGENQSVENRKGDVQEGS